MSDKYSIGVDIGGTKIAASLVNEEGKTFYRVEYPTVTSSKEALFETLLTCIDEVFELSKVDSNSILGIGVGVPGKVDIENGIAVYQNNIPWENFPLVERLKETYGQEMKIIIDNDVKMAAYAEYKNKSIQDNELFTYVTISTGIAATSIENNQIIRGSGFSGEIGFLPIKIEETYYNLEKIASGPAIEKKGRQVFDDLSLTTKDIFELYNEENKHVVDIINDTAEYIAHALYTIVCVLDPKLIVIGGSVAHNNPQFVDEIRNELSKIVVPEQGHILDSIYVSQYGSDNGIIGAGQRIFG